MKRWNTAGRALTLLAAGILLCSFGAVARAALTIKSAMTGYVRTALTPDGSVVLSVLFDESNGTGRGHDILYADTNFNGRFEPSEKVRQINKFSSEKSHCFPTINVPIRFNAQAKSSFHPYRMKLMYREETAGDTIFVEPVVKMGFKPGAWKYRFSAEVKPALRLASARVLKIRDVTTVDLTAGVDKNERGHAGFGISVKQGDYDVDINRGAMPVPVTLTIRDQAGQLIRKDLKDLDNFSSRDGCYDYSVKLSAGKYVVEASVVTGPLAGTVVRSRTIVVEWGHPEMVVRTAAR